MIWKLILRFGVKIFQVFLENLNQRYSYNLIMESNTERGFTTEQIVENKVDDTIKITYFVSLRCINFYKHFHGWA